jgi:hypothetical protein
MLSSTTTICDGRHRKKPTSMTDISGERSGPAEADAGLGLRPKNIGARVKRVEDRRLLAGQGMFTADRFVPGALHVAFRRSDHAHALITRIDTSAAAEIPGVFAIYTARDLDDLVEPVHTTSRMSDYHATEMYPLARKRSAMSVSRLSPFWPKTDTSPRTRSLGSRSLTNRSEQ